jgi:hypothetical protein
MFDINQFTSTISSGGLARTANFTVQITPPSSVTPPAGSVQDLMWRAESATFPGRQVQTNDYLSYGPIQKVANASLYVPVDTTIYVSTDLREKLFFERWQDLACGTARASSGANAGQFDIGYYANYIGTVQISQYDTLGNVTNTCTLLEAWPGTVGGLEGHWERNEIHRLTIGWYYRYFTDDTSSS